MNRLKEKYQKEIVKKIKEDFKLGNVMEVPRLIKISINSGVGNFRDNKEAFEIFTQELTEIATQKVFQRQARMSEAGFKMKKGDIVGLAVTLRGERMWSFIDKLNSIVLPRVRDFKGISVESFDQDGNYSLGIREHTIFPEVNANTTKGIRGLQLTIVMSSSNTDMNREVLKQLGFPFRKDTK